jgi:UDPglucose 6-dehydrogenase
MFNTVQRKKIAVLGFTFKANTSETRASPAIDICMHLLTERAQLHIYDPRATKEAIVNELERTAESMFMGKGAKNKPDIASLVTVESDAAAACEGAHAVAILTEWEEFKRLDYKALYETMQRPAHIFDGRRIIDCDALREIGFAVYQIGAGADGLGEKQ